MPIVDVQIVCARTEAMPSGLTQRFADALGRVFSCAPGRTWVRVHALPADCYAENEARLDAADLPVFVEVLRAKVPIGEALAGEVKAVTIAVAGCLLIQPERVHVQYAPAAAGRQAFGGKLVE